MSMFDGDVVWITGAAGGIGAASAHRMAAEGARLILSDACVDTSGAPEPEGRARLDALAAELTAAGAEVVAVHAAAHVESDVARTLAEGLARFGRLDALVTCAGIDVDATLFRTSLDAFAHVMSAQVTGSFLPAQVSAKQMLAQNKASGEQRGGRVVMLSAASGLLGQYAQVAGATAASAVLGMSRTLAVELQRHGVMVNTCVPLAKTRMTAHLPVFESVNTMMPSHVAPAISFLASRRVGTRTGNIVGAAGGRMYAFKLVESHGKFKDGDPWLEEEIAEHWPAIVK